jgi:phenylacetate-CoA ligase
MNLYQDLFFRGIDALRRRRNIQRLHQLRQSQFWGAGELRLWQIERLNALLSVARKHSPFHAERLAHLVLPLRSLDELASVPVLTKAEIRSRREEIRTRHLPKDRYGLAHTGGSTAEPTYFYLDRCGRDWNRASVYRSAEWAGTRLGRRAIDVSGSPHDLLKAATLRKRLADLALRHRNFGLVAPRPRDFEALRQKLRRFRAHSIWGYTSGLVGLARYLQEHAPDEVFPHLAAVVTSSETLLARDREAIEEAFGPRRLFDHYGSREMYIAAQCQAHDGYHLHADVVLTEVVDAAGEPCAPGEPGRVLVTDMSNHAFPFLRYEIGDVAVLADPAPCPCGVTLPKLASVEGRIPDMVVLPDRVLTPPNFASPIAETPGVLAFQVRQERMDTLRVLIEADDSFDDRSKHRVREIVEALVAGHARVEVVTDEPIVVPESGKRRFVVSEVAA